jgi:drug/metabolite transporter (DMT)-like permease
MNSVFIATIAGLFAALCWGTGHWMTAKSSRQKHNQYAILFAVQIPEALVLILVLIFSKWRAPTLHEVLVIALVSILFTAAYLCFIKALSSGALGLVEPLANTYPLITLGLAILFLNNVFSSEQFVAMATIVFGAIVLAYKKNRKKLPLKILYKDTFLALAAALFWGLAYFILDPVVGQASWQIILGLIVIFMTINAGILLTFAARTKTLKMMKKSLRDKYAMWASLIFAFGSIGFYSGSEHSGSLIIPTVIASGAPLVASILGAVVDGEKIGTIKRTGAVLVITGIIALNII